MNAEGLGLKNWYGLNAFAGELAAGEAVAFSGAVASFTLGGVVASSAAVG